VHVFSGSVAGLPLLAMGGNLSYNRFNNRFIVRPDSLNFPGEISH
jgi:hypothetical protein